MHYSDHHRRPVALSKADQPYFLDWFIHSFVRSFVHTHHYHYDHRGLIPLSFFILLFSFLFMFFFVC